ncbi:ABC transporter substrate-binding protein [Deinococcus maricopensis]|uniref:ABC-type transporter, periplasmic subunit n=1 Tax=Deinococcus maricopensis (strain DSM 21211 / LMG 22137 / NRRL B-23946 / LB-34) TaxID=709986 RepID=E8UBC6_DEIML|nr:ABC transporter substrate-binding protein [Deinococcus maricopensis]ADV68365.1 ABC-type transporter, periplasmic subunit [Deinococcus maricopensis DSM 21211]
MKIQKKSPLLLGTVALSLLLGACGQGVKNADTLVNLTIGDWSGFDPVHCYDTACGEILQNAAETLYFPQGDSATDFDPLLAADLPQISDGGKTYTIKLNPDAKFSDGSDVTSEDVKYSLMRQMITSADDGPAALLLEPIVGNAAPITKGGPVGFQQLDQAIQTPDADTVVINLPKPFAPFTSVLAHTAATIYSKKAAVAAGEWDGTGNNWEAWIGKPLSDSKFLDKPPVSSGPFVVQRYDKGQQVIMARNDNYWREKPKLATVVVKSVNEPSTAVQTLKAGDADMISVGAYPRNQLASFQELKDVTVTDNIPTLNVGLMLMNFNIQGTGYTGSGKLDEKGIPANFFSDANVRKAFAQSFDYQGYIKDQLLGAGIQMNSILVKGLPAYDENSPLKYEFDRDAATDLFKKAWGGKLWDAGFTVPVFYNSGNANRQKAAEILKLNIEAINPKFHVDVREAQFSSILADAAAHRMTVWFGGWQADYADPHNFAQPFYESNGNYPQNIGFKNAEFDKLITQAVAETDNDRRTTLYNEIAQMAYDDAVLVPLYQTTSYAVQRDWVKGRINNPLFSGNYYYPMSK